MTIFKCEKSINGILDALFFAFTRKIYPDQIIHKSTYQFNFIYTLIEVPNFSISERLRVKNALILYGGEHLIKDVKICLLNDDELTLKRIFDYTRTTLNAKANVITDLSNPAVCEFRFLIKQVLDERHRATGFLRFAESENGVLYAKFAPDNDICELVSPHFLSRLKNIPFIIHDVKRNKIVISDGTKAICQNVTVQANFTPSQNEQSCITLWKKYFGSVNISERKNVRTQNNFMPKRYRKFMPETWETSSND